MTRRWRYEKGKYYEFKLMNILYKKGFFVIRAPGSGRKYKRFYIPDIVAIRKRNILLIECRFFKNYRHMYLEKEKYKKMIDVAKRTSGQPLICIYYKPLGQFRCIDIKDYDWETDQYFVYRYKTIISKGFNPGDL